MVSPRPAVQALPTYRPGRNPADLAREIGVERAVKLASNEVAFPPLPAVVEALAATAGEIHRYPDNGAVDTDLAGQVGGVAAGSVDRHRGHGRAGADHGLILLGRTGGRPGHSLGLAACAYSSPVGPATSAA